MLSAGLLAQFVSSYLRLPSMLALLAAGTLLGPSVTGAIDVPLDSLGSELLLTLGVSLILFHGGLHLSAQVLNRVAVGLVLLVIPGVILTALITGLVASNVFGVSLSMGMLIGAVLAPTDPAILIPLFERMNLRPKLSQTIIAESALNDAIGAVLAITIAVAVVEGGASFGGAVQEFTIDLAISTCIGIAFGILLALAVSSRRPGIWRESAAIAVLALLAGTYFSLDWAGGSGYLGAFIAGLIVGNMDLLGLGMHSHHEAEMRTFVATVADVMVMFVFVTLGANLPWAAVADQLAPALIVVAVLVLVARPIAVLVCLLPDRRGRWSSEELFFLSWTRETGVMAAALAGIMVSLKVPDAELIVATVALALFTTLLVQSTTKRWIAGHLGLLETSPIDGESASADQAFKTTYSSPSTKPTRSIEPA
jgi:cell volume regulation protein A